MKSEYVQKNRRKIKNKIKEFYIQKECYGREGVMGEKRKTFYKKEEICVRWKDGWEVVYLQEKELFINKEIFIDEGKKR